MGKGQRAPPRIFLIILAACALAWWNYGLIDSARQERAQVNVIRRLVPVDVIPPTDAEAPSEELDEEQERAEEGEEESAKAEFDVEVVKRNATLRAAALTVMDNMGLEELLQQLEKQRAWWDKEDREVLFWGSELFHKWYSRTWSRAFRMAGLKVVRRPRFGPVPKAEVAGLSDYAAVFCLTYEISGCFNTVAMHQKLAPHHRLNMAPFLRETLWNKGSFCRTIQRTTMNNPLFDDHVFKCFIHPEHTPAALEYAAAHPGQKFIIKPLASGGGRGIHVVDSLDAKRLGKPVIIQNFLGNPHLINGYKWDIRAYAVVTSTVPLRAYLYSRGLVRFAADAFDPTAKNGGKRSQFLTNISLGTKWQKKNVSAITWSFGDLHEHMDAEGESYDALMEGILGATSVMFLSAEQEWRRLYEAKGESCRNCFKHFGLDIIIDRDMNARVIEANGQPGMTLSKDWSDHYSKTKLNMVRDLVRMVYYDKPVASKLLAALEDCDPVLFEQLTETDWQYLLEYVSERQRMGGWLKVYPNRQLAPMHAELLAQQPHLQERYKSRLALNKVLEYLEREGGVEPADAMPPAEAADASDEVILEREP